MKWQHLQAVCWLHWRLRANQMRRAGFGNAVLLAVLVGAAIVLGIGLFVGGLLIGLFALERASPSEILYLWGVLVLAFLFGWLAGFYAALSGDTMPGAGAPDPHFAAPGGTLRDRFPTDARPAWLGTEELDVYAAEFERTGLTGALNRYRNMDRDWEDLADHDGAPITQPSLFIGGALDASTTWMADAIEAFARGVQCQRAGDEKRVVFQPPRKMLKILGHRRFSLG